MNMNMSFSPEQNSQQNKKESSDIFVPEQGKQEFFANGKLKEEVLFCENLDELSDLLLRFGAVVSDDEKDVIDEATMENVARICRTAFRALTEESIARALAQQGEIPDIFSIRERYVQLLEEKMAGLHPTLHPTLH